MRRLIERSYYFLKEKQLIPTGRIRQIYSKLYHGTTKQIEETVDAYFIAMLKKGILLFFLVLLISGLVWIGEQIETGQEIHLIRSDYGEEEDTYCFIYQDEEQETQEISIILDPVEYRSEELEEQFRQGFAYLEQEMLGENQARDQIQMNLNLQKTIPDSGLSVSWSSDDYELLEENGTVKNEELTKPQQVRLLLELSYGERVESREYALTIQPKILTDEEEQKRRLRLELENILQESRYEKEVYLPSVVQGVELKEAGNTISRGWIVLLVGMGVIVLLVFRQREALYRQLSQRRQELEQAYPYLVNQLLLYIGAGATVKGAFERILKQYENGKGGNQSLYRELVIMQNEMHSGVTQEQAYINFGKRIAMLSYMKLSSLLAQQIRKGVGSLTIPLEEEEHMAFEHRKERAKRAGEEAGTKLLLPMILLMVLSMLVVVCPALMNFM